MEEELPKERPPPKRLASAKSAKHMAKLAQKASTKAKWRIVFITLFCIRKNAVCTEDFTIVSQSTKPYYLKNTRFHTIQQRKLTMR